MGFGYNVIGDILVVDKGVFVMNSIFELFRDGLHDFNHKFDNKTRFVIVVLTIVTFLIGLSVTPFLIKFLILLGIGCAIIIWFIVITIIFQLIFEQRSEKGNNNIHHDVNDEEY